MAYSVIDHADDIIYGELVAEEFVKNMPNRFKVKKASLYEDSINHYDYLVIDTKTNKSTLVEVKGAKRRFKFIEGTNILQERQDDVWVEFIGVSGQSGWIFGKADYFAIYRTDGRFCFVNRLKLLDHVMKNFFLFVTKKKGKGYTLATQTDWDYYQRYRRSDNEDLIALVPSEDIEKLTDYILTEKILLKIC